MQYSVLMSVYYKESPEYFRQSIDSIFCQTVLTDDFVLVCDGPLTDELDAVISENQKIHKELKVVRLEKNSGLGIALNEGIKHCKNELVARMDSDDISRSDRCERQLGIFEKFSDVDIVSGSVEEFSDSVDRIDAVRELPETHGEIIKFAKKRSPFNHPCVMYKKSAVEAAGGYKDLLYLEDYYLWVRMLLHGSKGYNIQEPLLWMRAGADMYKRRAGKKYVKSTIRLFKYMKDNGFISCAEYLKSITIRTMSSFSPNWLRKLMYRCVLRK